MSLDIRTSLVSSGLWLVCVASGCTAPPAGGDAAATNPPSAPPFNGNTNPVTTPPPPSNDTTGLPSNGENVSPPIDTSDLDDEANSNALAPEPPLTAAELAELSAFDGLVPAGWSIPVSPRLNETKVARAYLDWKSRFYKSCDDGSVYVLKDNYTGSQEVASEGIAYGMLLAVGIGDRETFDGLWQYYREHRNGNGVMNWLHAPCGGQIGDNGASDADLDAAMALLLAESRWGGFAADAGELVAAIGQHETEQCGDGRIVLKPGDAWGGCGGTVNPSYFSPAYYRRFAAVQTDRAAFWNDFAGDTYEMLRGMQDQVGGLLPDWGFGDGRAEDGDRGQYGYEAVRAPWRIALDLGWSGSEDARGVLRRMSETIDAQGGITAILDQEDFADKRNSAFLGSLALSGIAVSQAKFDAYVTEWETYESVDDSWYYQATLRVLFLMAAGGFFPVEY